MTRFLVLLSGLCVAGCSWGADNRNDTPSEYQGAPSPRIAAAPSSPTNAALLEWSIKAKRAAESIGKSKTAIVNSFGEPSRVNEGDGVRTSYMYEGGDGLGILRDIFFWFNKEKTVQEVDVDLWPDKGPQLAGSVWHDMGGKGDHPSTILSFEGRILEYWKNPDQFQAKRGVGPREFPLAFRGKLISGITAVLDVTSTEPHLKGEARFSADTDRREVGPLTPNPGFNWRNCTVIGIIFSSNPEEKPNRDADDETYSLGAMTGVVGPGKYGKITQVTGTVTAASDNTLTITPVLKRYGDSQTYTIPTDVEVTWNTRYIAMSEVKPGQKVTVHLDGTVVVSVDVKMQPNSH